MAGWRFAIGSSSTVTQTFAVTGYGFLNESTLGPVLADGTGHEVSYRGEVSAAFGPRTLLRAGVHAQRQTARETATRHIGFWPDAAWTPRVETVDGSASQLASFLRVSHTLTGRLALDGGALFTHTRSPAL